MFDRTFLFLFIIPPVTLLLLPPSKSCLAGHMERQQKEKHYKVPRGDTEGGRWGEWREEKGRHVGVFEETSSEERGFQWQRGTGPVGGASPPGLQSQGDRRTGQRS